jgi:predicted ferric reductase
MARRGGGGGGGGDGGAPSTSSSFLSRLALTILRGILNGAILAFVGFWLPVVATRRWRDDAAWATFPPKFGCSDDRVLDACTAALVSWLSAVPAVATLAACLLVAASHCAPPPSHRRRLFAQRQIPLLRSFWSRWCGGLSRQDALLAAGVLLINAAWALSLGTRYEKLYKYFRKVGGGSDTPAWALEAMLASIALGQMLMPNLALLFVPVARGSPLLAALRVSYPSAVRAHRWLGHLTMALASAHSLGFWGVWITRGQFLKEALDRGARINNLAGGASFLGGLALWITSLESARRSNYSVFIATHHLGWWVFFLAGTAHYSALAWWFAPGLVLYFADAAVRVCSWRCGAGGGGGSKSSSSVLALEVAWEQEEAADYESDEESEEEEQPTEKAAAVVALVARPPSGFAAADAGIVWLRCPAISVWQWHPFEYVLVESGSQLALAMHIKAYGRWSRALARLAAEAARSGDLSRLLVLQVEAPYGDEPPPPPPPPCPTEGHENSGGPVVVLAGGIGATAALSLLREMSREREQEDAATGKAQSPPGARPRRRVLFIWAARHAPELAILLPRLLDAARLAGVDLDARLYFTGRGGARQLLSPSGWASASASAAGGRKHQQQALTPPPLEAASAQCPVLAPGRWLLQLAQRASAHALAAAGALGGLLAVRWLAVVRPATAAAGDEGDGAGWTTAQAGLASAAAIALGAGLPALAVAVAARAAVARLSQRQQAGVRRPLLQQEEEEGEQQQQQQGPRLSFLLSAANEMLAVVAPPPTTLSSEAEEAGGETSLPIGLGRPSAAALRTLVADWLLDHSTSTATVAELYAMGPEALVAEARTFCDDLARQREEQQRGQRRRHKAGGAAVAATPTAASPPLLPPVLFRLRTHEL